MSSIHELMERLDIGRWIQELNTEADNRSLIHEVGNRRWIQELDSGAGYSTGTQVRGLDSSTGTTSYKVICTYFRLLSTKLIKKPKIQ